MDNLTPITREEILMNDEPLTPITREEKILAGEDLNPVTRREYFLKKYRHAGGEVMVEGLSVTENGTYTAPEGKAYSPVEVAVSLPENAYLLKEASGSLVSFNDGADLPMPSFICNIDAVQDLHGQDAPWVGGAGKNKLPMTVDGIKAANTNGTWSGNIYTEKGVTFSIITDNDGNVTGIEANGTATNIIYFTISNNVPISAGAYRFTGCPNGGGWTSYVLYARGINNENYGDDLGNGVNHSFSEDTTIKSVIVFIASGYTVNNILFKPMYCLSSASNPNAFAPYSNICPISGHTGVDAWVRGKNLANPATVTTLYPTGDSTSYPNQIRNSSNTRSVIAEVTPNTTYTISKKAGQRFRLAFTAEEPAVGVADYGYESKDTRTTITVTSPSNAKYMIVLFWSANTDTDTEEDMLATLQIELGETATTYEPYNPQSQTIQVSWQTEAGEVFGDYVDLVSGKLTVTDGYIASYNGETLPSTWISDRDTYAEGTSPTTGAEVVYKLANPQTYQLNGNQIKSLLGNNNAWCSTGDVDIDYFAKEV